jgi:hypothetical protein
LLVRESLPQKIDIARIIFNYYNLYGSAWRSLETIFSSARPLRRLLWNWTAINLAVKTVTRDDHFLCPFSWWPELFATAASPTKRGFDSAEKQFRPAMTRPFQMITAAGVSDATVCMARRSSIRCRGRGMPRAPLREALCANRSCTLGASTRGNSS